MVPDDFLRLIMQIEVFSRSKYRRSGKAGDDVPVCIPGRFYGVFDGATDAYNTEVNGESAGHIAARTVAQFFAGVAVQPEATVQDGAALIRQAAACLGAINAQLQLRIPASTTVAAVFEQNDVFRILVFGDSGVRVNGNVVYTHHKVLDAVSTAARVATYRLLSSRLQDDAVEHAARRAILLGFQQSCDDGLLTRAEIDEIVGSVSRAGAFTSMAEPIRQFLMGGIRTQFKLANNAGHPLGFGAMNGTQPLLSEMIEVTVPKAGVQTLEIFTDGYFSLPAGTDIAAWEDDFARVEREDYHKIGAYRGVKGSTVAEYSDDRTVISLAFGGRL